MPVTCHEACKLFEDIHKLTANFKYQKLKSKTNL